MLLCSPPLCLKCPHQYTGFWAFFCRDWLLQSPCICLNSKLDCIFFSDYTKTKKLMVTYCWKFLGIFLSFTQRNADQCTHVMARVKPTVCSLAWVQLEWRNHLWLKWLPSCGTHLAVCYQLCTISSHALGNKRLLPSYFFRSTWGTLLHYKWGWDVGVWVCGKER